MKTITIRGLTSLLPNSRLQEIVVRTFHENIAMTIQTHSDQSDPSLNFKKEMQTRHIVMLALGGVIGTGLFLTSGYTVNQAGPLGAVIAYIIGAVMVYLVMVCLGEVGGTDARDRLF